MNTGTQNILLLGMLTGLAWMGQQPSGAATSSEIMPRSTIEKPALDFSDNCLPEAYFPAVQELAVATDILEQSQQLEATDGASPASAPDALPLPGEVESNVPVVPVEAQGTDERGQAVTYHVWGVPIGRGRVATVSHLVNGATVRSVTVNGVVGRFYRHSNHNVDFALVAAPIEGGVTFRKAIYRERVFVHAKQTRKVMRGVVTGTGAGMCVSLEADEPGIRSGDSGSPVVSESGEVLGVVTGFPAATDLGPAENRVVMFSPIVELQIPSPVASAAPQTQQPGAAVSPSLPANGVANSCPDGNCNRAYQYQQPVYQRQRTFIRGRW